MIVHFPLLTCFLQLNFLLGFIVYALILLLGVNVLLLPNYHWVFGVSAFWSLVYVDYQDDEDKLLWICLCGLVWLLGALCSCSDYWSFRRCFFLQILSVQYFVNTFIICYCFSQICPQFSFFNFSALNSTIYLEYKTWQLPIDHAV